jgi:hypothetical protein
MIKEFSIAGYILRQTTRVVRQGDPFTATPAVDLQELIRFLIEKCGMTPEEVRQILHEQLGFSLDEASKAIHDAELAMEHEKSPLEEDDNDLPEVP